MSTASIVANGASGIERTPASDTAFALALGRVCEQLAEQIVADGEGAASYLTTDLSYDYVRINADYRT